MDVCMCFDIVIFAWCNLKVIDVICEGCVAKLRLSVDQPHKLQIKVLTHRGWLLKISSPWKFPQVNRYYHRVLWHFSVFVWGNSCIQQNKLLSSAVNLFILSNAHSQRVAHNSYSFVGCYHIDASVHEDGWIRTPFKLPLSRCSPQHNNSDER